MNNEKDVKDSYLLSNGMVVTFNFNNEQIPELEGKYTEELARKILERSSNKTNFNGWGVFINQPKYWPEHKLNE